MELKPEFQTTFFEGLLLPDKLTAEYMQVEPTAVDEVFKSKGYGQKNKPTKNFYED